MTEEHVIAELKPKILNEKRDLLCQNLNPKSHYPYLRSRYILSEDDEQLIDHEVTRRQKVSKFLDILITKGKDGFDELVKSILQERTQIFLAKELNKAYEEKVKRVKALLSHQDLITDNGHKQVQTSAVVYTRDKLLHPQINQSQNRHSYPEVKGHHVVTVTLGNRDSISDLGVDTDKLPKPVKQKHGLTEIKKEDDGEMFKSCPEVITYRENSLEEHEDKSFTSSA